MPGKFIVSGTDNNIGLSENILIRLFPNPATNDIYVESDRVIRQVSIYNTSGIMEKMVGPDNRYTYHLDVSNLAGGLYFMKVTFEDNTLKTMRFIVNQ